MCGSLAGPVGGVEGRVRPFTEKPGSWGTPSLSLFLPNTVLCQPQSPPVVPQRRPLLAALPLLSSLLEGEGPCFKVTSCLAFNPKNFIPVL